MKSAKVILSALTALVSIAAFLGSKAKVFCPGSVYTQSTFGCNVVPGFVKQPIPGGQIISNVVDYYTSVSAFDFRVCTGSISTIYECTESN